MTSSPDPDSADAAQLRFLRRLVTTLTVVMIAGMVVIITLLVLRLTGDTPPLPDRITLPDGTTPQAVTIGPDWIAVIGNDDRILIFDRATGKLRQSIALD